MNPKLIGSNIIDCIPQTGECPNRCSECFYNGGRFFRTLDEPLIPSCEEVGDKIVRVNTGNDSNVNKSLVLEQTKQYKHKFYNTSIPKFDFHAPVVFTCNPKEDFILANPVDNIMFVRIRTTTWNKKERDVAIQYYKKLNVPIVLTFMRFYNKYSIPENQLENYEWRENILNNYFCIKTEAILNIMKEYNKMGVLMCGTPYSSNCVDCGNCENLYWRAIR
jgi:hypothetical protein